MYLEKGIVIGSRGSDLALWQAYFLQDELKKIGFKSSIVVIKTKGDKIQDMSFDKIEGKGFFTKEIEDALLDKSVDLAVHSMKDLPTSHPDGLVLGATSYRADPRDLLLINKDSLDIKQPLSLKKGAIVGTSSARRKAQMLHLNEDIILKDIRGNVPTRIKKLKEQNFDAILLAKAGVDRLKIDLSNFKTVPLHVREFVPAPAQGVLAFQCRKDDMEMRKLLVNLHDAEVAKCTNVERKVLAMMEGGCQMPLGVYCEKDKLNNYHCYGAIAHGNGQPLVKINVSQSTTDQLAETVFNKLLEIKK